MNHPQPDPKRARAMERAGIRAALERDNERAAYLFALADALRRGLPMLAVPAPRLTPTEKATQ